MHNLFCILASLCLASAIPLPQFDSLTSSDIVDSYPLDTTFTNTRTYPLLPFPKSKKKCTHTPAKISFYFLPPANWSPPSTANTDNYSPDSPLIISENWSSGGLDQSWTGKDRQPSDSTGMGPRPNIPPSAGGTWPATPGRDGSNAPLFNPKPKQANDQAPPVPVDSSEGGGFAGAATLLMNKIINNAPQGLQRSGPW